MNLNDSTVGNILDSFVNKSGTVSPIGELRLESNDLTSIPQQITFFKQLSSVQLYNNNITEVPEGIFNFAVTPIRLVLYLNQIKTIAPYAFRSNTISKLIINLVQESVCFDYTGSIANGYGNGSYVLLNRNDLTRFDSAVFKPMLDKMAANGGDSSSYLSIYSSIFEIIRLYKITEF